METIQRQKAALRRRLAAREQAMTQRERELSDGAIIYHVTQTEEYRRARTVFAFVGCGREIGTRALLVCAPVYRPGAHGVPPGAGPVRAAPRLLRHSGAAPGGPGGGAGGH